MKIKLALLVMLLSGCSGEFTRPQEQALVHACTESGGRPIVRTDFNGKANKVVCNAAKR